MGIFSNLFGKKENLPPPVIEAEPNLLAFVLLEEAHLPQAANIAEAGTELSGGTLVITEAEDSGSDDGSAEDSVLMLELEGVGSSFVALMPLAIPDGEAEHYHDFSPSAFSSDTPLRPHAAHLVVSLAAGGIAPAERMMAFTSLLAAVVTSSPSVGVYWGNAGATHTAEFFLSVASENEMTPRTMLWNGISRAVDDSGNASLLSLGMHQLGLPNIHVVTAQDNAGHAYEWMFDLLGYVIGRGEPIPDGDTLGTTEDQRIQVAYENSPAGDGSVVMALRY